VSDVHDDIEAIKQLKARYFRTMDTKDEIELTSPTTATGVWALEDQLWWPEGGPLRHMHGFGHYHETYEKAEAGWRIKSMTITRLHRLVDPQPPASLQ
jgi:hypothetical protein